MQRFKLFLVVLIGLSCASNAMAKKDWAIWNRKDIYFYV